jgi:hypothetical protein
LVFPVAPLPTKIRTPSVRKQNQKKTITCTYGSKMIDTMQKSFYLRKEDKRERSRWLSLQWGMATSKHPEQSGPSSQTCAPARYDFDFE